MGKYNYYLIILEIFYNIFGMHNVFQTFHIDRMIFNALFHKKW